MNFSITRRGDYGLTAITYLAQKPAGTLTQIQEIAQHCGLPEAFLAQILRLLVRGKLVNSKKGVGGGFMLARSAAEISFLDVLEALEGPVAVNRCQNPADLCEQAGRCSMEHVWARAQGALVDVLRESTLADLNCAEGHYPVAPAVSRLSSNES